MGKAPSIQEHDALTSLNNATTVNNQTTPVNNGEGEIIGCVQSRGRVWPKHRVTPVCADFAKILITFFARGLGIYFLDK